jgi:hypothetical protein
MSTPADMIAKPKSSRAVTSVRILTWLTVALFLPAYVGFHRVCFPFYWLFELRFTTLWLGTAQTAKSMLPESRHLCSLHRERYCLVAVG